MTHKHQKKKIISMRNKVILGVYYVVIAREIKYKMWAVLADILSVNTYSEIPAQP